MLSWLAAYADSWGPLRLLGSYSFLLGLGFFISAWVVIIFLPLFWHKLPVDYGKIFQRDGKFFMNVDGREVPYDEKGEKPAGKPTGAGIYLLLFAIPLMILLVPELAIADMGLIVLLFLSMLSGYLDDIATSQGRGWSGKKKGFIDLAICIAATLILFYVTAGDDGCVTVWWPFVKGAFHLSWYEYIPGAAFLLWFSINATNCSDGVDGLAGTLSFFTIIFIAALLYAVIGNMPVSSYLLIPATAKSAMFAARWSVIFATVAGAVAGYLWWNAFPSKVLMGDAGSRSLGLLIGIGVLLTGNPCLIFAIAPVLLANGGAGLVRSGILKIDHKMKWPEKIGLDLDRLLLVGRLRFPLHDHCRRNLGWSNQQVLTRFLLLQIFLLPLLFMLMLKIR